jgi:hypothetical protein
MTKSCVGIAAIVAVVMVTGAAVFGQTPANTPKTPSKPAVPIPHTSWDGKPNLSGVWGGHNLNVREANLAALDALYRPEVAAQRQRLSEKDDPAMRCAPYAYPRAISMVHPVQILQTPNTVVILSEYSHSFRVVPTDGRPPAQPIKSTFQGTSVGHWESDTLVVDVSHFNGEAWMGHGQQRVAPGKPGVWFTSDALHIVERWRLVDGETLDYQAVVDDPKMLTGPWMSKITRYREPFDLISEAVCIEDSLEHDLTSAVEATKAK